MKTVDVPAKFRPLFQEAQEYVKRYFEDRTETPERGTIDISGQRYLLVRAGSMSVEFFEMVRSLYTDESETEALAVARSLLFDIAHAMGLADAKVFAERMQLTDPIARLSAGPVHFAHAGWAFVHIHEDSVPTPTEDFYLLYDHPYSFESDAWRASNKTSTFPVCVMNAGYSSGWCESSFGLTLVATEILCRAKGDSHCRFIMAPPAHIERHIEKYRQRQTTGEAPVTNYEIPGFFLQRREESRRRRQTEALLLASQELNARIIEALPGGLVHVGADGAIRSANSEACRLLGLSFNELTERYVQDFATVTVREDGTLLPVEEYPVTRALASGETQEPVTVGVRQPSGLTSWGIYTAVPVRSYPAGELTGVVVTFLDITERKLEEARSKELETRIQHAQKLESLGVLAGGIAHDFNNLLMSILANASVARRMLSDEARVSQFLDQIERSAENAADLTHQMLAYAGKSTLKVRLIDLSNIVREMVELLRTSVLNDIHFELALDTGLPLIAADESQMRQVVLNLVTNAAESLGQSSGNVRIATRTLRLLEPQSSDLYGTLELPAGDYVTLEVIDDGCGMDEATKSKVFDPFFTTKFSGRGLGLAAVLGIMRSHNGGIRINTAPGDGTTFQLLFPTAKPNSRQEASAVAAAPEPPTPEKLEQTTVLVVDDDPAVLKVMAASLAALGLSALSAASGQEGLDLFKEHQTWLTAVILDLTMPDMDGAETFRRMRQVSTRIPIILASGYNEEDVAGQFANDAPAGYLAKPFRLAVLEAKLREVLGPAFTRQKP